MNIPFKKTILAALIVVLAFAALPVNSVFAADINPPQTAPSGEKLEQAWAHQLKLNQRLGKVFENTDDRIAKLQQLIDKAASNGKDVSALQAALDAFASSLNSGRPIYESMQVIVNSHSGFDENGKVTDIEQAKLTVQDMHAKMQELKSAMNGTGKALREAIKAFRAANKPASSSPDDRGT